MYHDSLLMKFCRILLNVVVKMKNEKNMKRFLLCLFLKNAARINVVCRRRVDDAALPEDPHGN